MTEQPTPAAFAQTVSHLQSDPDRLARAYLKALAAAERTTSFIVEDEVEDIDEALTLAAKPKARIGASS